MRLNLDHYESPLGDILLVTDDAGALRACDFSDYEDRMCRLLQNHYGPFELQQIAATRDITQAFDAYFDGQIDALNEIRVETGGTPFQRRVWQELRAIAPGRTRTYGQIAASVGRPTASRAVGAANGSNPVAIVVPCHRVVGANKSLTGYAGGLSRKRWLLDHETVPSKSLFSMGAGCPT